MKTSLFAIALGLITSVATLAPAPLVAAEAGRENKIDETSQFIFHSVLEGLYEDGLTNDDVAQILMRREKNRISISSTRARFVTRQSGPSRLISRVRRHFTG